MMQHRVVRVLVIAVLAATLWAGGRARALTDPASPNRADTPGPLARLMQLSLNSVNRESAGALRAPEVAARCATETQQVRSYRSWLVKRDYSQAHLKENGFAYVEWNFDFVAPDRFHVRQTVRERPPLGNLNDERITAGDVHFTNPKAWTKVGPDMGGDFAELNRFLRPEKFLDILRTAKLNSMTVARADDGAGAADRYVVLEYENVRPGSYQILFEVEGMTARARLWVDAESGLLAKGELIFKGKNASNKQVELTFEQVFADYNSEISVQIPAPRL